MKQQPRAGTVLARDGRGGLALDWVFWDDNDPVNRLPPESRGRREGAKPPLIGATA